MSEHDQAVLKAISDHPALGKIGDGHIINAIVANLPAIMQLITEIINAIPNQPVPPKA